MRSKVSPTTPTPDHQQEAAVDNRRTRDPHARSLQIWHQVLLAGLIYESAAVPFAIAFDRRVPLLQDPVVIVLYAWEVLFLLDFYVKATTGFYLNGSVIYDVRWVRRRYIKSREFAFDLLAIIPWAALPVTFSVSKLVLEIPKVFRAYRVPRYLSNVDDVYVRHFELLKISKLLVGVILLSHYIACIRFSFGYDETHSNHWLPDKHDHPTVLTQYLQSTFWAFGVLTGLFEGELPRTVNEFVFTIAVAICGFSVFTCFCAIFFLLSRCEATNSEAAEARIAQLEHVLAFYRVPDHVGDPVVEYLRHYYTGNDTNDREVTKLLCPSIVKDVQIELLKDVVAKIPVFTGSNPELIELLTSLLERICLPSQCTLFSIGEYGDAMYIIYAGVLDVIGKAGKIRELRKNDIVGELSLFSNLPRSATVVTTTYCVLYKLSRFNTEIVLKSYPKAATRMKGLVTLIMKRTLMKAKKAAATSPEPANGTTKSNGEREAQGAGPPEVPTRAKQTGTVFPIVDGFRGKPSSNVFLRLALLLREPEASKESKEIGDMSTSHQNNYDNFTGTHQEKEATPWWSSLLLKKALDCSGIYRVVWVFILQVVLIYNWCLVPLQIAFPALNNMNWLTFLLNGVADVVLWADIYINFNLAYMQSSERIQDPTKSAVRYFHGAFVLDLVCTLPYDAFVSSTQHCLARLPRLLRFWRASGHFREVDAIYPLRSKHRLLLFAVLLFLLIHIESCLYFSVTFVEGFSHEEEAWLPHDDIELHRLNDTHFMDYENVTLTLGDSALSHIATMQYMRSFYFATHKLTGLGKGVEPNSDLEYLVGLMFMFSGFVITAVVVDNVQKRFTASAHEEKEFFAIRSRIQSFLRRQNAPAAIYHRVNVFLEFWWAAHRGALIDELTSDLPISLRKDVMRSIYTPALQTIALLAGVRPVIDDLEDSFISNAELMLYGQGEYIYREGDIMQGLFILLRGQASFLKAGVPIRIIEGSLFGTALLCSGSKETGYCEDAVAESGCVVIFLSRTTLEKLYAIFPTFGSEAILLEKRQRLLIKSESETQVVGNVTSKRHRWGVRCGVIDPDSKYVVAWETWLAIAMTIQWVRVLLNICFGITHRGICDSVTIGLEVSFVVDVYIRSCLGYRQYGNKVMELKLIRRRYFHSWHFLIDTAALVPLFAINWIPGFRRSELLNINKVLRLLKVPTQYRALEQRHVKFTTELRLVKLVYYIFVSTHVLGCIYFDFASHASGLHGSLEEPGFGENAWTLPVAVQHENMFHQYFAANFWAFGVMSASNTGELPESTSQCVLTITTQVTGFFLFAYVIGNFSDIIELSNAEHREFNSRFGSMRRLLAHFALPTTLESKVKMLLFFKRFHTITQEEEVKLYLPPPIMTDIRLMNLQPMIEKVPFLKNTDISITRMLVSQLKQRLVLKDEYVYKYEDEGTDMFFVFTGTLSMFAPVRKQSSTSLLGTSNNDFRMTLQKISDVFAGDFFGENSLFADTPRTSFVRTKTSCILYSLSRQSLDLVFGLYPSWMNQVLQTVKIQQKLQKVQSNTDKHVRGSIGGPSVLKISASGSLLTSSHVQNALSSRVKWWNVPALLRNLSSVLETQGSVHIMWLRIVTIATLYVAFIMPSCIVFDACRVWDGLSLDANLLEVCCFVVFVADIWINLHLKESELTAELYEVKIRKVYRQERLLIDVIAALPLEYVFYTIAPPKTIVWLGVNRCVKVLNVVHYMNEIHRQTVTFEWARLQTILLLYILLIYWGACAYLLFADHEGYSEEWSSWFPPTELEVYDDTPLSILSLRLLRGLFFAVTAFIKKGRTFMPKGQAFVFALIVCFVGLMVMAFMIGEIASLFISSIDNEVSYRKNHIAVEHTIARWKGVIYQDVFASLPSQIREDMLLHIVDLPLQAFIFKVFRPILQVGGLTISRMVHAIAVSLSFDCYPSGERVVVEGRMPDGIYFVVSGKLVAITKEQGPNKPIAHYTRGDFFGERGVLTHDMCENSVQTQMPCELVALAASNLESILRGDEFFSKILSISDAVFHHINATPSDNSIFPMAPQVWDDHIRTVLEQHRQLWRLSAEKEVASLPRPETHWRTVVLSVLDKSDAPLPCLQVFRPFIEMVGPKGDLFEKSGLRRGSGQHGNDRKLARSSNLRSIVDHISAVAINISENFCYITSLDCIAPCTRITPQVSLQDPGDAMPPPVVAADSTIYDKQLAWKQHGQRKLASRSQELRAQQEQECTFTPKIQSRPRRSSDEFEDEEEAEDFGAEAEAALLHPTEAQESSIQLHLARQERAREHAQQAQQKLSGTQQSKDFSKVTTVEPFALSTTNWKSRSSTTESPIKEQPSVADQQQVKSASKSSAKPKPKAQTSRGKSSRSLAGDLRAKEDESWASERATLVSIIDAQRRELELREQAQQEAVRVAERFATATQSFEERLVVVEQSVAKELEDVKRLLAAQAASTDLILTSLGITRRS